jgi:hypothetical protein
MHPLHKDVAVIGLKVLAPYGFVLAGGYAVQAHGLLSRMSEDVDLFTNQGEPKAFAEAVGVVQRAWRAAGLGAAITLQHKTFARFMPTSAPGPKSSASRGSADRRRGGWRGLREGPEAPRPATDTCCA